MNSIDVTQIKLYQLRAFVAVADSGSFGEAATHLNLTQSSVSYAIASLETELGMELFSRGRRGASLTFVGEQMIDHARQMLQLLNQIIEKAIASRGLQTGQVRIASIRSLATHWLPPVLAIFNQQFPQVNVTLVKCFDYTEIQTALRDHIADIGLTDVYDQSSYDVVEIGLDEYVALLPYQSSVQNKVVTWQQINQYPLIMPAPQDHGYAELRKYIADLDNSPTIAYEINEDSTIVSMVSQGIGAAILPYLAALPIPAGVQVCHLPSPLTRLLGAVIIKNSLHSPAVFTFLDTIERLGKAILTQQLSK